MLVPKSLRNMLMFYFHNGSLGVHLGVTKTLHKIKQFFWPHMEADIKQYVRVCEVCKRTKPSPNCNVGLHTADVAERPLQTVPGLYGANCPFKVWKYGDPVSM